MTPERWARVKEIFGDALDLPGQQRAEYLKTACAADTDLHRQIDALLKQHDQPGAFLDHSPVGANLVRDALGKEGRTFQPGEVVSGRFRIQRFLGEGGMGEVYAAEDAELHGVIALKTLRPQLAGLGKFAERFRREVQMARQVTHPNVCRIFDAGRQGDTLYFTMELLEGETLAQRLERTGRMTPEEALPVVHQLCEGLFAAHQAGIVHRDFKSANVILAGERAVITDFGLARLFDPEGGDGSTTGLAIGTPAYMAPEQFEGVPAGPAADLYALGVVLYEMVTGQKPYTGGSPLAMAAKKVKSPPRPPRELAAVSETWEAVLLKCLAAKPEVRFANAHEVSQALEGGRFVRVPAASAVHRKWLGPVAAVAALLAGAGIWNLVERSRVHVPPEEAVRWYKQGAGAMAENSYQKASNLLEKAVSVDDRFLAAHARLADVYTELDMLDKAKDQVIHVASLAPDRSRLPKSDVQMIDAAQAMVERDYPKAVEIYGKILDASNERGPALLDLGRSQEKANLTDKAIATYAQAAADPDHREAALLHLGMLNMRKGEIDQSLARLREAEDLFHLKSNVEGVTETKLARGRAFENTKRLSDAAAEMNAAVETAKLIGNPEQLVRAKFELSRVDIKAGRTEEAKVLVDEALELANRNQIENLSVSGLNNLGDLEAQQSRFREAETYFTRALEAAKRARTRRGEARAQLMIAQTHFYLNEPGAMEFAQRALAFYRPGGYSEQLQSALAITSEIQASEGRYAEAIKTAEELQKEGEIRHQSQAVILALRRIADVLLDEGDYPRTLALREREAELDRQLGRAPDEAAALISQGEVLWRLGRYKEYTDRMAQARSLLKSWDPPGTGRNLHFSK